MISLIQTVEMAMSVVPWRSCGFESTYLNWDILLENRLHDDPVYLWVQYSTISGKAEFLGYGSSFVCPFCFHRGKRNRWIYDCWRISVTAQSVQPCTTMQDMTSQIPLHSTCNDIVLQNDRHNNTNCILWKSHIGSVLKLELLVTLTIFIW